MLTQRTLVASTSLLALYAGAVCSLAEPPAFTGPHVRRPRLAPSARSITPLRMAAARTDADGRIVMSSGWVHYDPPTHRDAGDVALFDNLELDAAGNPSDGVYTPDCGLGSSRYYLGPGYSDPNTVNDIEHLADPLYNGAAADHVAFMLYSDGDGVNPTEHLYVVAATYDSFGHGCALPAADNFRNAVVYDFGPQPVPGGFFANVDLRGSGLYHLLPASGSGAYSLTFLKSYDPQTGTGELSTSAQAMLWGTKPSNPSAQGPAQWDDDSPTDGQFDELECYDLAFGLCPDPLGAAAYFGRHAPTQDCNLNGIDDFLDVVAGTSTDLNANGVPDECDGILSLTQLSFADLDDQIYAVNTPFAELGFRIVEPARDEALWFNAVVNGNWVVQNAPIVEVDGHGRAHTFTMEFDSGGPAGQPLPPQPVIYSVTAERQEAPPAGAPQTVPVANRNDFRGGVRIGDEPPPPAPAVGVPDNFQNGVTRGTWKVVRERDVPGVAEEKNHCLVGATARALAWLNDTYKLEFPDGKATAQDLYDTLKSSVHMNTSKESGTQIRLEDGAVTFRNKAVEAITKFRNSTPLLTKRFDITDKTFIPDIGSKHFRNPRPEPPTPAELFKDIGTGQGIVLIFARIDADGNYAGGHAVTVVGAVQEVLPGGGDGTLKLLYRDDNQGDQEPDRAAQTKTTYLVPRTNPVGWRLQGGIKSPDSIWTGYIMFCPNPKYRVGAAQTVISTIRGVVQPAVLNGTAPTPSNRKKAKDQSYLIEDQATYLVADLELGKPPCVTAEPIANSCKQLASTLYDQTITLECDPTLENAQAVLAALDQLDPVLAALQIIFESCECAADFNKDGTFDAFDYDDFVGEFFFALEGGDAFPDFNSDGYLDAFDYDDFVSAFFAGCGR